MISEAVEGEQLASRPTTLRDLLSDGLFLDGDWIESKDQDPDGEVRLIQLADVGDGAFRDRSSRYLTMAKARELGCTFLEPGDILIARMPEPLGRACVFPGVGQPAVTAVDVCIVRPNADRALGSWLVRTVNAPQFRAAMAGFVRGTTRQRISRTNLGKLSLPVPSLEVQMATAAELDEIEARQASIAGRLASAGKMVEHLRGAVLAAACDGSLTADFRAGDTGGIADHDRASEATELPNVDEHMPAGWISLPLGEISEVRGGIQKKPDRAPRSNPYPYLRVANVQRGRLDLSEIAEFELFNGELQRYVLQSGDLLVVEGNGSLSEIGRAALWHGEIANCVHQNHLIRVRPTGVLPEYLEMYWNSPSASRTIADLAVTTAGLYNLSVGKITRVPVPVPPLDEQEEIVKRATAALEATDRLTPAISAAQAAVHRALRGALGKAFRGELTAGRMDLGSA